MMRRTLLIYRDLLGAPSEGFVADQALALIGYEPFFVGSRRHVASRVPLQRSFALHDRRYVGRLEEAAFKLARLTPPSFRRFRCQRPALVHAHFGPDGARAIGLARALRVPLVTTIHGFDATLTDEELRASPILGFRQYPGRRRALQNAAALVLAVSNFIRDRLLATGFNTARTRLHYIGVDTDRFSPVDGPRKRRVLFVGRLVEQKGVSHLLRAMHIVRSADPTIQLAIIGDGPSRTSLEREAADLRIDAHFLGTQPPEVVRDAMREALLFCGPSHPPKIGGQEEGLGLVFLEAQAVGTPVVSYSSGGIPEAVAHGRTGLLADAGDWRGLAEYILQLAGNPNRWSVFSEAGRQHVRDQFDLRRQTSRLESLYDEVCGV